MTKTIDTLVDDILGLFKAPHSADERNVRHFADSLASIVAGRLAEDRSNEERALRMSNLGKRDRQLWYDLREGNLREDLPPDARIKFLFGDILEALLLFLAREAGHAVEDEQKEVEVNGVLGHIDAIIDGVVVDVKSASTFSFKKFRNNELAENDPFGYYEQLAGYATACGNLDGAFLAIDKTLGHITLLKVDKEELQKLKTSDRVDHLRAVLASDVPPDRCYKPVEHGSSGNMKLDIGCSYCSHKFHCWSDVNDGIGLRSFLYASGPVHLTKVVNEPKVNEITF